MNKYNKLQIIEQIIEFTKGAKLIKAIDSNARSTIWHDTTTNNRGKMMENFIVSKQSYVINEDSPRRTLQSTRRESNTDLTIVNDHMLADVTGWETAEVESASDHNILKLSINLEYDKLNKGITPELNYIIKETQRTEFFYLFHKNSKNFQIEITGVSRQTLTRNCTQD